MGSNVILIGMPGCGKSTVGVLLAKTLGMDFTDTDLLLQQAEGALLQQILQQRGVEGFLDAEERLLRGLDCAKSVVATGGSAVCRPAGMARLRELGQVVYLKVPLAELERRVDNMATRGIAMEPGQTLASVYAQRAPLYEKYAGLTVETGLGHTLEETVAAVLEVLLTGGFATGD